MIKKIAVAAAVLIALLLGFAATRPATFRIERSADIQAPPEKVFALLEDFRSWPAWSPWEKMDPEMKRTHEGPPKGKGAVYGWEGNGDVGVGRMEIVEAVPPSKLLIKLDFIKPFKANNTTEFTLEPQGGATTVKWAMYGPNNYVGKLIGLFCNMDKMVGKDFEAGLAGMKAAAEKAP